MRDRRPRRRSHQAESGHEGRELASGQRLENAGRAPQEAVAVGSQVVQSTLQLSLS